MRRPGPPSPARPPSASWSHGLTNPNLGSTPGAGRSNAPGRSGGLLLLGRVARLELDLALGPLAPDVHLHWIVVSAPILISVLIALANRRAAGKRWVLLRGAAESVK